MSQQFKIVRDLNRFSYQKGSDRIVVTQFDTGIHLTFDLFERKERLDLNGYRVLISFVDETGELLLTEECPITQDLSMSPCYLLRYVIDERLTQKSGQIKGVVDLFDKEGFRTALNPFTITLLPYLLKEPASLKK